MEHEKAEAFIVASTLLSTVSHPLEACNEVIRLLADRLGYRRGAVFLRREIDQRPLLFSHCSNGFDDQGFLREIARVNDMVARRGDGAVHEVIRSEAPLVHDDVRQGSHYLAADPAILSEACYPLIVGGDCIGCLNFEGERVGMFETADRALIASLATQIALHLDRARLQQIRGMSAFAPEMSA